MNKLPPLLLGVAVLKREIAEGETTLAQTIAENASEDLILEIREGIEWYRLQLANEEFIAAHNPVDVAALKDWRARMAWFLHEGELDKERAPRVYAWEDANIHPHATLTLSGWQVGSERARRFYFTTERDAYATRIGRPGDFGVISAVFYRERHPVSEILPRRRAVPERGDSVDEAAGASAAAPTDVIYLGDYASGSPGSMRPGDCWLVILGRTEP